MPSLCTSGQSSQVAAGAAFMCMQRTLISTSNLSAIFVRWIFCAAMMSPLSCVYSSAVSTTACSVSMPLDLIFLPRHYTRGVQASRLSRSRTASRGTRVDLRQGCGGVVHMGRWRRIAVSRLRLHARICSIRGCTDCMLTRARCTRHILQYWRSQAGSKPVTLWESTEQFLCGALISAHICSLIII